MQRLDRHHDDIRPEADYLKHLSEGRFMLLRSRSSGHYIFHPRVAEPLTGGADLEWVEASGGGVVYSTSVMRERDPANDYNLSLIDLDEGPRMMSCVEGIAPSDVRIGMRVSATIVLRNDAPLVVFHPAGATE